MPFTNNYHGQDTPQTDMFGVPVDQTGEDSYGNEELAPNQGLPNNGDVQRQPAAGGVGQCNAHNKYRGRQNLHGRTPGPLAKGINKYAAVFIDVANCNASSLSDRTHRQHVSAPSGSFATAQMAQGQGPCGLDLAQRKTGLKIFHIGQIDEALQGKARKAVQVFGHHLQFERAIATDVVTGNDLGQAGDGGFELARGIARVALGIDPHKCQHPQADFPAVQLGTVTHYVTTFFERTHTPPTGRRRQTHAVGQFGVAEAAVTLQGMQDSQIKLINHF